VSQDGVSEPIGTAAPAQQASAGDKPKWLGVITISAMVLGGLYGCCGMTSVGGLFVNSAMQQMQQNPALDDAMRQVLSQQAALQARIFPFAMTIGLLGLVHSAALLFSGFMAYSRRQSGRKLLALVCMIGIGVEAVSGSVGLVVARETTRHTEAIMMSTIAAQQAKHPPMNKQVEEMTQTIAGGATQVGNIMGVLMLIVFFVIKTAYFVTCGIYLRRKEVVDYFEGPRPAVA